MIPEPFTYIAAGFGIAMALISAAASTLESAKQRIDKFIEYEDRLRQMSSDIRISDTELESCLADWRDDRKRLQSLDACAQMFGDSRRKDLEDRIYQVINALGQVQQVLLWRFKYATRNVSGVFSGNLQLSAGPIFDEAWDWMLHARREKITSAQKPWLPTAIRTISKNKIFLRATFAVLDGDDIKSRTERLQKSVSDFRKFTDLLSKSLPMLAAFDPLHATFADRVARLIELNQEWSNLSTVMSTMSGRPFEVLPRLPDKEGCIDCPKKGHDVTTSMLIEGLDDEQQPNNKAVVYVTYLSTLAIPPGDRRSHALNGLCKGLLSSLQISSPLMKGKSMREFYKMVAKRPHKERQMLQRLWELERAEAALSLITWTLLLWNTPWTRCICTARLWRYSPYPGKSCARMSMLPCIAEGSPEGCSFETQHADKGTNELREHVSRGHHIRPVPTIEQNTAAKRTLTTLAVTLCEMALLSPIEVRNVTHQPLEFNCDGLLNLSEKELLTRVQRGTSMSYRKAVQKCFDYAKAPICDMTTAADVIVFADKVIVPIEEWKEAVLGSRSTMDTTHYTKLPQAELDAIEL